MWKWQLSEYNNISILFIWLLPKFIQYLMSFHILRLTYREFCWQLFWEDGTKGKEDIESSTVRHTFDFAWRLSCKILIFKYKTNWSVMQGIRIVPVHAYSKNKILWKKTSIISVPFSERNRLTLLFKITPSHWGYHCRDIVYSVQNATVLLTYSGWGHKSKQVTKPAVRRGPRGFTRLWGLWISRHTVDTENYFHWRLICVELSK